MRKDKTVRTIGAGVVAAAAAGFLIGVGPAAAAPDTGSAGGGSADLALTISSSFDTCHLTVTNRGPDTAYNVIAGPSSLVALLAGGPPRYLGNMTAGQQLTESFGGCGYIAGTPLTYFALSTTGDPAPANNTVTYNVN
ncbi:hypothetical protein [Williamsia muralis]|uniref:Secreted protein n=1 Tax=Williamsia marianensis TaxID=85044 RepID=A0A2G3PL90_WILMA|nr:hypothetical protein [Williamsia marianensis]PHV66564.1 hypothetical protein CSW57_09620 [Williamsia marianensis]